MSRATLIAAACSVLVLGATGLISYTKLYTGPVSERRDLLVKYQNGLKAADRAMAGRREMVERRRSLAATLLGSRPDAIEHELRTRLVDLAGSVGISGAVVSTGAPQGVSSPVLRARVKGMTKGLRERPDFAVIEGRFTGVGTLEQALTMLALIEQQAWVHRIRAVGIKPADRERTRFELRADVSTLLVPGLEPGMPAVVTELPDEAAGRVRTLAASGMFVRPEAPVAKAPEPEPDPAPESPPPPPYDRWRVAGLIDGGRPEAWLVEVGSGNTRVLSAGESFLGLRFEGGSGEDVEFERDGVRVSLRVGQTLDRAQPVGGREQ